MKTICFLFIFAGLCLLACRPDTTSTNDAGTAPLIISIQPFEDIDSSYTRSVYHDLSRVYPHLELKPVISLPKSAYYKPRQRYRADSLIEFLSRCNAKGHVTIGLTAKDISTTKGKVSDWGVMGLGFCPGTACVASVFRLSKGQEHMQLFKVAIHELGHTQGLPHCEVKSCFMRDAEGRNPTNDEKEFCPKCRKVLEGKGFRF